jgi:hypothetical protein
MKIKFQNDATIDISFTHSALAQVIKNIYQHLQHVELMFRDWDNPYWIQGLDYPTLLEKLDQHARAVNIKLDHLRCRQKDQTYFNELHVIYEKNYNGDPHWLNFHEHIHLCETLSSQHKLWIQSLSIDYREKAGLLEKKFDPAWLQHQTKVDPGDVYINWAELGKTPYDYWQDQEPSQLSRLCELSKPWLILRPKINVALAPIDFMHKKQKSQFESWWQEFEKPWCQHWNLPGWSIENMFSVGLVGRVNNVAQLDDLLKKQIPVTGITFR